MIKDKSRQKQAKTILCLLCVFFILHTGFSKKTLSAGFTGTFHCYEHRGELTRTFRLTVVPEENTFYLYNKDIDLYRKGTFERINLKNYIIEGKHIEKQNIKIANWKFSMQMDGQDFVFEKVSDTTIFIDENIPLLAE